MAVAFQTKSFPAIVAGMVNRARSTQSRVTDFVVGSKVRTLLEAAAIEIDEFYQQVLNGILAAIPVALYQTLSFPALGAVSASNPAAFNSGQDAETPAQTKTRFQAYISTLSRATDAALEYGASTAALTDGNGNITERVRFALTVDPPPPAGQGCQPVSVYVHNGVGGTSANLVALAQKIINGFVDANGNPVPGYKAAGVPTTVYAAQDRSLGLGGSVVAAPGYSSASLAASADAALANYVEELSVGASFILAEAYALVMAIPGVANWLPAGFSLAGGAVGIGDVAVNATQKLVPGAMALVGA